MTAIAYRDGVLATDTASFQGDLIWQERAKIVRAPNGALAAAAGVAAIIERFHRYMQADFALGQSFVPAAREDRDFTALIIHRDGRVQRMEHDGESLDIDQPFAAIGGPYEFLIGAMAAGASAPRAVALAIKHHSLCGGRVATARISIRKGR